MLWDILSTIGLWLMWLFVAGLALCAIVAVGARRDRRDRLAERKGTVIGVDQRFRRP